MSDKWSKKHNISVLNEVCITLYLSYDGVFLTLWFGKFFHLCLQDWQRWEEEKTVGAWRDRKIWCRRGGGFHIYAFLCLLEAELYSALSPGIITRFQPVPISPGAATETTAQRENGRMAQTLTARDSQRGKPGAVGLCDGGETSAAWGQVKWSQRCWVSSGG